MKTIASLKKGEFLRACYRVKGSAEEFFTKTGVVTIAKELPMLTGKESAEEKAEIIDKHSKEKKDRIIKLLMDEYADETYKFIMDLTILDEGETEETVCGEDIIFLAGEILTTPKMIDFFMKLMRLAPVLGGG